MTLELLLLLRVVIMAVPRHVGSGKGGAVQRLVSPTERTTGVSFSSSSLTDLFRKVTSTNCWKVRMRKLWRKCSTLRRRNSIGCSTNSGCRRCRCSSNVGDESARLKSPECVRSKKDVDERKMKSSNGSDAAIYTRLSS